MAFFTFGSVLYAYSIESECIEKEYTCNDLQTTEAVLVIPDSMTSQKLQVYLGLSGFYSPYLSLKSSFSTTQLQANPRDPSYMPYDSCDPIQTLNDVSGVSNPYIPIDKYATSQNWQTSFNMTYVSGLTLRPCGALFYWIPTDSFSIRDPTGTLVDMSTSDLSWDELDIPSEPPGQIFPYIDTVTEEFVWADPSAQWFRAWMRANVDPTFVLKVGEILSSPTSGDYKVRVSSCRDMDSSKFIRICTTTWVGTPEVFLASVYFGLGSIGMIAIVAFVARCKQLTHID